MSRYTRILLSPGGSRRVWSLVWLTVAFLAGALGCDGEQLDEDEQREIEKVVQTGVDMKDDPYVQAETMRVLALVDDPSLSSFAEQLVSETYPPMVRTSALEVLLRSGHEEARKLSLARFNRAEEDEKLAILKVVDEHGSAPLRRELTTQALRSSSDRVRKEAFEIGPLERLRRAQQEGDEDYLDNTLYPELGRRIDHGDPVVSAVALRALVDAGEDDRAEPLLRKLDDERTESGERLAAATILGHARVEAAVPHFEKIVDAVDVSDGGRFQVPERIDKKLVRAATLGLIANGYDEYLDQAQRYFSEADSSKEANEVLEAVASSDAEDAAIMLEVAMQDARRPVRFRAIELLAKHDGARASSFFSAMRDADYATRARLTDVLVDRFPDQWTELLDDALQDDDARLETLELLAEVIQTKDDIAVIEPLEDRFDGLAASDDERVASLAAVCLVKVDDDEQAHEQLEGVDDPRILYAYLEHLVRHTPGERADVFRDHFYSDRFSLRLLSAAGLLKVHEGGELGPASEGNAESNAGR